MAFIERARYTPGFNTKAENNNRNGINKICNSINVNNNLQQQQHEKSVQLDLEQQQQLGGSFIATNGFLQLAQCANMHRPFGQRLLQFGDQFLQSL
jgi:hypothetical protein